MRNISVDNGAYKILVWAKRQCKEEGIEHPSFSDAIRWMRDTLLRCKDVEELREQVYTCKEELKEMESSIKGGEKMEKCPNCDSEKHITIVNEREGMTYYFCEDCEERFVVEKKDGEVG